MQLFRSTLLARVLAAALILCCLAPATGLAPARAQGGTATITVTPATAAANEVITITGDGFAASETVQIQAANTTSISNATTLGTRMTDATGKFTAHITIPGAAPSGSYQIIANGLTSHKTATAKFQVTNPIASLQVSPTSFAPGGKISVKAIGFLAKERLNISLFGAAGSTFVATGIADANGALTLSGVTVPFNVHGGKQNLIARGETSNRQATQVVEVNAAAPTLRANPTVIKPGEAITVIGAHFQPGEQVTIDVVALATSYRAGTVKADSTGAFSGRGVIPATTPEGTLSIVATGTISHLSATTQIKVGSLPATITISSSTVKPGQAIRVVEKGFIPGETVNTQLLGGKVPAVTIATSVAGVNGTLSGSVVIPTFVPSGQYTLVASGQTSGRSARTTLTVQAPVNVVPTLSIIGTTHVNGQPYRLNPGGLIQLVGSGFPANTGTNIVLSGAGGKITLIALRSNNVGAFGPIGITVPASTPAGAYTLQAIANGKQLATLSTQVGALTPHLLLSTSSFTPGAAVTVRGSGFAPGEQIVIALNGAALSTKPTAVLADATGAFAATFLVPETVTSGANILIATGASSRASASATVTANLPVSSRWYFPNGDTTSGHRTVISILNANSAIATVKMTFLYATGSERTYQQQIPAHSLAAVSLDIVAGAGQHVSTILEADRQVTAESEISYAGGDSTAALGATGPSRTWYLAEGYTNGTFSEYITVMNPATTYSTIDVRFLPFNNRPATEVRFVMAPRSNLQINAGTYMPRQSISAIVTSDHPVVVERSMRFGANGRGAHDKIGVVAASTTWVFAEGEASATRQTFFTILNPNLAAPAAVTATFFDLTGKPVGSQTVIVDPLHRGNIKLNDVLPNAEVATILTSNVPVVVERPLYQGPANLAVAPSGSVVFGRNGGALRWSFPGGSTINGSDTRMFLFNPGLRPARIHAMFYTEAGAIFMQDVTLAPNSDTVLIASNVPGLSGHIFGAVLSSTNGEVFLAEESTVNSTAQTSTSTAGLAQ